MAVLSIQSHVVYGYAGNTAAVFPMQRLGHVVWAVNTVDFSNHTGYGAWRGRVTDPALISELVTGLEERDALKACDAVLSGYLGDAAAGKAVIEAVKKVKKYSKNALYACDPVMGDTGRGFYVKPDIPGMFKNELLPLADIACPNQFELETLTGVSINSIDDALKAIKILHEKGPSIVLVTSFKEKPGVIGMIASDKKNIYLTSTPELPLGDSAAGTGDMTTAVFLSRFLETKDIKKSLELCTSSVFNILEASLKHEKDSPVREAVPHFTPQFVELKIIEAQKEFDFPSNLFEAEELK